MGARAGGTAGAGASYQLPAQPQLDPRQPPATEVTTQAVKRQLQSRHAVAGQADLRGNKALRRRESGYDR